MPDDVAEAAKGLFADPRRAWGIVAIGMGVGFLLGFKVGGGIPPAAEVAGGIPGVPAPPQPCPECAERAIRLQQAAAARMAAPPPTPSVPGDPMVVSPLPTPASNGTFDHTAPASGPVMDKSVQPKPDQEPAI